MRKDEQNVWDLKTWTKQLALRVIRLCSTLATDYETVVMRKQLARCGTSVGAQYREACRARSPAEFRSKLQSALQELDETGYWMELLTESGRIPEPKLTMLMQEVNELTAILVASIKTSRDGDEQSA